MPIDIILKLRPASGTATDIATSITLAETAASEQQATITSAKAARDDALLDADPATLRKAEQFLADAREQGERISAVLDNLKQRHTAAVESETVDRVAHLKARTEASYAELSAWWATQRRKLTPELTKGIALLEAATTAVNDHMRAQTMARHQLPHRSFDDNPAVPALDATGWANELGDKLKWLAQGSRDPVKDSAGIATLCDARPPGTF